MLIFGFSAGLATDSIIMRVYIEKMQVAIQKGITACIQKDKLIDELKTENKMLKENYERLYDTTSHMQVACKKLMTLPAPCELHRTETYYTNGVHNEDLNITQTPICEKSKKD